MANRYGIEYVNFYTDGSSARKIAPVRKMATVELPKPKKRKRKVIYVDPVATLGILVAVCLLIMMCVGLTRLSQERAQALALAQYTEEVDPELVLAYHTQGKAIYWQFKDYQVPGARALAEAFAQASGYSVEDTPYESSFAGYKDWFIQKWRRPGFTIEAGSGVNPLPLSQFEEIYRDNLGILVTAATGLPEK